MKNIFPCPLPVTVLLCHEIPLTIPSLYHNILLLTHMSKLRRRWRTGKAGMLQSMESQRVAHDWVTELKLLWSVGDENSSLLSFRSMLKHNASSDFILHCKHCLKKREIIMNRQNSVTPSRSTNWLLFITMTCKHFNSVIPTYHSFSLAPKKLC